MLSPLLTVLPLSGWPGFLRHLHGRMDPSRLHRRPEILPAIAGDAFGGGVFWVCGEASAASLVCSER